MKKSYAIFLLAFCLLICFSVYAQTPEELRQEAAEAEVQREELENLQKEIVRAFQLHNSSFFNRVYSDDFVWTSPSGINLDKAAFVKTVQNSAVNYRTFVISEMRVRVFQQTAVVNCLWSLQGTANGNAFSRQSRVITVFVYGQRGWQVVASQETQLPG